VFGTPNDVSGGFGMHAMLRRLHAKFGDDLNITIMTRTYGFMGGSAPLSVAQEVDSIRHYYLDVHKLPVTVAVVETQFDRLPDGRRIDRAMPAEQTMLYQFGAVLADRDGKTVAYGLSQEAAMATYIAREIARTKGRSAASTP